MAHLIIRSPLFDFLTPDRKPLEVLQGLDAEQTQQLKLDMQRLFVEGMRRSLSFAATLDPDVRQLVALGAWIEYEPSAPEPVETMLEGHQVQLRTEKVPICANCRAPSTGFKLIAVCRPCSDRTTAILRPVKPQAAH